MAGLRPIRVGLARVRGIRGLFPAVRGWCAGKYAQARLVLASENSKFRERNMNHLTRRNLLTGAAAASAATALTPLAGSPAFAAAPLATTQAPGWYRYN